MNRESIIQNLTEHTAETCGYVSVNDAIGRSVLDVSKKETAQAIIKNDRAIISSKRFRVDFESYTRLDDIKLTAISIKFPWMEENNIVGIFGCSLLIEDKNQASLIYSMSLLIQTGLLASSTFPTHLIACPDGGKICLNERDMNILYLLVRGMTAKGIANKLGLSPRTVEHRFEQIKTKLSVSTKAELIDRVIDLFIHQ